MPASTMRPETREGRLVRGVSLLLAVSISLVLMVFPYVLGRSLSPAVHAILPLLLLSVCGAFVHGLGYVPESPRLRRMISPAVLWPALAVTTLLIALLRR